MEMNKRGLFLVDRSRKSISRAQSNRSGPYAIDSRERGNKRTREREIKRVRSSTKPITQVQVKNYQDCDYYYCILLTANLIWHLV